MMKSGERRMFPPAYSPRKITPEEQIRELEEDTLTQWVWDLMPKVANTVHRLNQAFSPAQPENRQEGFRVFLEKRPPVWKRR
jgi:hypothetical protein